MKIRNRKNQFEEYNEKMLKEFIIDKCKGLDDKYVDAVLLFDRTSSRLYDGIETKKILKLLVEIASAFISEHYDFEVFCSRVIVFSLHKNTEDSFFEKVRLLYKHNKISEKIYNITYKHRDKIENFINYKKDYLFGLSGIKVLKEYFLYKLDDNIVERPQDMFMRISLEIHGEDLDNVFEIYHLMSELYYLHSSTVLIGAGSDTNFLSSSYFFNLKNDIVDNIFQKLKDCALIAKYNGSIGINMQSTRPKETYCSDIGGETNGLVLMLKTFESTMKYVKGKVDKNCSLTVYLEPWHSEIFEFLELRKTIGKDEARTKSLYTALLIPDLFMKRVKDNGTWSLFNPEDVPNLLNSFGDEFERLYKEYENKNIEQKKISARLLWNHIITAQLDSGSPFMIYKDTVYKIQGPKPNAVLNANAFSNIFEFTNNGEKAVTNVAAISLPKFLENGEFNYKKLGNSVKTIIKALDKSISNSKYIFEESKIYSMNNRPVSIGVIGLADLFIKAKIEFESDKANEFNFRIFETIYFFALDASCNLAKRFGTFAKYDDSILQKNLCAFDRKDNQYCNMWDWDSLKTRIEKYGIRNSCLISIMPTPIASKILGFTNSIEPIKTNECILSLNDVEYQYINKYLMKDLIKHNLWNPSIRNQILANNGSIQNIIELPERIRKLYKTAFEIKMKSVLDLAITRAPFIDQSQSINVFMGQPTSNQVSSLHFYAFNNKLKTGICFLFNKKPPSYIKYIVDKELIKEIVNNTKQL
ncbi:Ribonucleoside-diphosphate reductase [Spraguea lophii 42_110]|uniref:Ribonucleoside-diphosphate reductase n=1 Tax=Spraguea lophii (strain 42_110) TaxID=1358809 RepID=S7W906_SPRLO|nr:Ribonucleoside-diphosphate reductase [Spraguea lophii 42_110]